MKTLISKTVCQHLLVFLLIAIIMAIFISPEGAVASPSRKGALSSRSVTASAAGAALNSDLLKGGGRDDTAVLQQILNRAQDGTPIRLVLDGPALVRGLDVYGNTTIDCIAGAGLFLKNDSRRALIRNAHRSRNAIVEKNIVIRGCFLNGNRQHQVGVTTAKNSPDGAQEADGSVIVGLQLFGVNDFTIENCTLWAIRAFGVHIANANRVEIRNVAVDFAEPDGSPAWWTDGLHFNGPVRYLTIDGARIRASDDSIALNANDAGVDDLTQQNILGPFVGQGPITDVSISNVHLMGSLFGLRLLSANQRIDRVAVNNVVGTVQGRAAIVGHSTHPTPGNFGSIAFNNIAVDTHWSWAGASPTRDVSSEQYFDAAPAVLTLNGEIETIVLDNVLTNISDSRPVLWVGPRAKIRSLSVNESVRDPSLQAIPVQLELGSRIDSAQVRLDWQGNDVDLGKSPINDLGSQIGQWQWVDTPPMYVAAQVNASDARKLTVRFSLPVRAENLRSGVTVKVNGEDTRILSATSSTDAIQVAYLLGVRLKPSDRVTWSYDGSTGSIRSADGDYLGSVSDKVINPGL